METPPALFVIPEPKSKLPKYYWLSEDDDSPNIVVARKAMKICFPKTRKLKKLAENMKHCSNFVRYCWEDVTTMPGGLATTWGYSLSKHPSFVEIENNESYVPVVSDVWTLERGTASSGHVKMYGGEGYCFNASLNTQSPTRKLWDRQLPIVNKKSGIHFRIFRHVDANTKYN